jgi:serine carboxypeptidase-like clade 2
MFSGYDPCYSSYAKDYFNKKEVQKAFHAIVSGSLPVKWHVCRWIASKLFTWIYLFSTVTEFFWNKRKEHELIYLLCSDPILNSYNFSVFSVLPIYSKLIKAGLRVWLYRSGSLSTLRMSYIYAC